MMSGLSEVWNSQLPVVNCHHPVSCSVEQANRVVFPLGLLSLLDKCNHPDCSVGASALADPLADCLSYGLEDLVVSLVITDIARGPGAAAQDVFKEPFLDTHEFLHRTYVILAIRMNLYDLVRMFSYNQGVFQKARLT